MVGPAGGAMATKRIKKEIADLAKENLGDIMLTPDESNIFQWKASLPGPPGSPYEGGVFDVDIRIPQDYPFSPPHLTFLTKVYHCNIASTGGICLDLLKNAWSPALSLYKVILSLSSLLTDPNPADPLVPNIATEFKRNRKKHDDTARDWTKLYAQPKKPLPPPPVQAAKTSASASSSRPSTPRPPAPSAPSAPPPAPVAGVRRPNPYSDESGSSSRRAIELEDSDDENGGPSTNGLDAQRRARSDRAAKRQRNNGESARGGGTSAEDVIVIDE